MKSLSLASLGFAVAALTPAVEAQCQLGKILPLDGAPDEKFGISAAHSGFYAIVGTPFDDDMGDWSGSAYVFQRIGQDWIQAEKLFASDADEDDRFGFSVAIAGDYAAVGSRYNQDLGYGTGAVYVYKRVANDWVETDKLLPLDASPNDLYGNAIDMTDDYMVVGAHLDTDLGFSAGAAYVYERSGTNWTEVQKLTASDGGFDDRFGFDVSVAGNTILVGSYGTDPAGPQSGAAYVFERIGGTWVETQKLLPSDGSGDARFGISVDLDTDRALIGANFDSQVATGAGAAYVFEKIGGTWTEVTKLVAADSGVGDFFGDSVSIEGDRAIIGAFNNDEVGTDAGAVYEYERLAGGVWTEVSKFFSDDIEGADTFGNAVSLSGNTMLVTSRHDDDQGADSGSAYFFSIDARTEMVQDKSILSLSGGGAVTFDISTCPPRPGDIYALLGSISGTSPGIDMGLFTVPLNPDAYFFISVTAANVYPFANSSAFLDGAGTAQASFGLAPGTDSSLAGSILYHAVVVVDLGTLSAVQASPADSVTLAF